MVSNVDCGSNVVLLIGTLKIRFEQKTNEIAKFKIVDEKTNFNPLDKNAKRIHEI